MLLSPLLKVFYLLSLVYFANADIHTVAHNDPSVQYIPSVCDLDCTRVCQDQWWLSCLSDGSASHRTKGNSTSSNFSFRGSSITWRTRTAPDGGKAVVYIDAKDPVYLDTYSPVTNENNPLFTKSGLDPTVTHTISVLFDTSSFNPDREYERFVDVRYFEYDDGGTVAGGSSSQTSQGSSNSGSSSTSGTSTGTSSTTASATSGNTSRNSTATSSGTALLAFPTLSGNSAGSGSTTQGGNNSGGGGASVGNPNGSSSSHISLAATIGAALGGIALGLIIFFVIFWLMKERARKRVAVSAEQKEAPEDNASTRSINGNNGNNAASLPNLANNNSTGKFIEAEHRYSYPNARRRFHMSAYPGILGIGNGGASRERLAEREQGGDYQQREPHDRYSPQQSGTGSLEDITELTSPFSANTGAGSLGLSLYPPPAATAPFESGSRIDDSLSDATFMTPPPRYIARPDLLDK